VFATSYPGGTRSGKGWCHCTVTAGTSIIKTQPTFYHIASLDHGTSTSITCLRTTSLLTLNADLWPAMGRSWPFQPLQLWWTGWVLPTTYKTRWRGLDILKLQYMPYMRETFNLKATHFILRGNTCSYSTTSNADSPLSMLDTSVSYHLYLLLICVMFTLLLDRWAPVGEDRRKACSYLSDSGAEGRCYIHVTPALSCMKSLRAVKHLVTVW